ncbi:MAG: hypothetical protein AAGD32_16715, partial [Planctomycetota bacterium]
MPTINAITAMTTNNSTSENAPRGRWQLDVRTPEPEGRINRSRPFDLLERYDLILRCNLMKPEDKKIIRSGQPCLTRFFKRRVSGFDGSSGVVIRKGFAQTAVLFAV